jgi:hypothetical protein
MVLREWKRLGIAGGSPGRRCALVSGVRSLAGMAGWFGRNGHGFRTVARETVGAWSSEQVRVWGVGCVASYTRRHAWSWAARVEWVSERAGTRLPLSTLSGMPGAGRAGARAGPTGRLVGRGRLGELDGGEWGLLARGLAMASSLSLNATGDVLVMPAREREGKVRCEWCFPAG